jgi:hypothetical protein
MNVEKILRNYFYTFGLCNDDIDFLVKLVKRFGEKAYEYVEEAIEDGEVEYEWISHNLKQGNGVLQGLQELVIRNLVYNYSGWEVEDWDWAYATLNSEKLHAYAPHLNEVQKFLVEEGVIANEEVLIKALKKKQIGNLIVPVFVAVDGTEYLAAEDLLSEWEDLSEIEDGVTPLDLFESIDIEEAREVLTDELRLKDLLAQAV